MSPKTNSAGYGFFGLAAGEVVVVAAAGLVAGFSVVVAGLLGALFRAVMTSVVKSTLSLE